MNRDAKKCIKYYIDNIKSEKYKEYLTKRKEEGLKNHREYIRENKPEWIGRTDYYEPDFISAISFYDVLDNEGTIKLLRKLYSLPKRKYKVRNYYKKPGRIKKYDYIHLKYSESGWGRFAEIELLDDSYVSNISISWCQLNSYYAFYVYEISFKKLLDEERYYSFMRDTMNLFCRKDYVLWYPSINHIKDDELDGLLLETMDQDYFPIVCQHYITSLLYSEQGRQGPLINMVHQSRKDKIDIEKIYIGDMDFAYYSRKENFFIISDYRQVNYALCAGDNRIPNFTILGLVAKYGNSFYYHFAGRTELKNYENSFSKYFSGRKQLSYSRKFYSLIRKMKSIAEVESRKNDNFSDEFDKNWEFYVANDKQDFRKHVENFAVDFQAIYQENFSYLQMLSEMRYTRMGFINSIVATIISVVAAIVAILALFG